MSDDIQKSDARQSSKARGKLPRYLNVKQLAHEYACRPQRIRDILRKRDKRRTPYSAWVWRTHAEAREVRNLLSTLLGGGRAR